MKKKTGFFLFRLLSRSRHASSPSVSTAAPRLLSFEVSRRCSDPAVPLLCSPASPPQCRSPPRLLSSPELSDSSCPSPSQCRSACSFARPPASPPQTAVPLPSSRHPDSSEISASSRLRPVAAPFLDSRPAGVLVALNQGEVPLQIFPGSATAWRWIYRHQTIKGDTSWRQKSKP